MVLLQMYTLIYLCKNSMCPAGHWEHVFMLLNKVRVYSAFKTVTPKLFHLAYKLVFFIYFLRTAKLESAASYLESNCLNSYSSVFRNDFK